MLAALIVTKELVLIPRAEIIKPTKKTKSNSNAERQEAAEYKDRE